MNHDIQLISGGGGGILSSSAGVGDLDRAPGAPTAATVIPANMHVGATTELEDPPGLFEKVIFRACFITCGVTFATNCCRWSICSQSGFVIFTNLDFFERVIRFMQHMLPE